MSDSSRVQFRRLVEVTFGTTPATAMTDTRMTGESLGFTINNEVSNEIRSDRQTTDLIQVGAEAGGDINAEISYGEYDDFLESALYQAWLTEVTITAATISAATTDDSFNDSGSGFGSYLVGSWIEVRGFTDALNNGYYKVVSVTTAKIVVDANLADEGVGPSITIKQETIRNGVVRQSFSLEKEFIDITQFISFTGMLVNTMSLEFNTNEILTGTFNFLGLASARGVATIGTGAPTAAGTTAVMNSVNNVALIREGDYTTDVTVDVQSISLSVANNLRPIDAIGTLGHVEVGAGRSTITGNLTIYFEDGALYDKYLGSTASSLSWKVEDTAGNAYIFDLPNIKFVTGEVVAGAIDEDVMVNMDFQALMHTVDLYTLGITRFAA